MIPTRAQIKLGDWFIKLTENGQVLLSTNLQKMRIGFLNKRQGFLAEVLF